MPFVRQLRQKLKSKMHCRHITLNYRIQIYMRVPNDVLWFFYGPSIKTPPFPLSSEFWRHYVLTGGTQRRASLCYQSERMKIQKHFIYSRTAFRTGGSFLFFVICSFDDSKVLIKVYLNKEYFEFEFEF